MTARRLRPSGWHTADSPASSRVPKFLELLGEGASPGALGDNCPERVTLCSGFKHQLTTDREPDTADPLVLYVGLILQERDGGEDVPLTSPTEHVAVAVALSLPPPVEEQTPYP